eukprot:CAMPEP_0174366362 /NCGR_PEP_ID=MMETSP0811_2-20130205/80945_1 /TAXON_ID=73025 ORGANISM="Eutreptiella gymnastica-like, Strain CCMP1594" /NCGR_SAMPLE_ID=MMETSP0811_2 /ASSEMBLY_ACC=CAM_ASM_000667 /LENGTH=60 /DNA_ID=CAMNT_0015507859 /DNA_START=24 /DNA_END=206 /DNA_ORIENTATION=-
MTPPLPQCLWPWGPTRSGVGVGTGRKTPEADASPLLQSPLTISVKIVGSADSINSANSTN